MTRRDWMKAGAAGLGAAALAPVAAGSTGEAPTFSAHFDHVLGTSLDLWFVAPDAAAAEAAERAALAEIDRLRRVFSLYDPLSELGRLNRATGPFAASADLRTVHRAYDRLGPAAGGACNPQVGAFAPLWAEAEETEVAPDAGRLAALASEVRGPAWEIDETAGTVTRLTPNPLDLNAAAKGYIIGRAAAAVRAFVPAVVGGLINLGGDMTVWGEAAWTIGIQDPARPAENNRPLGGLRLSNAAVATSGGYQRGYTVAGARHSHLIDPRSGRPADAVSSATVVAPDSVTANLLATTLCVLGPEAGLRLVAAVAGAECLIVAATGLQFMSPGFPLLPVFPVRDEKDKPAPPPADPWPADFQLSVALEVPKIEGGGRYRRPYVAVWIEGADGKPVRTLSVWGNSPKWLKDLSDWWKIGKDDKDLVKAVTRATRGPGKYELAWDGKDDTGNPVGRGTYTVRVEVHREHGKHLRQTGKIECGTGAASVKLEANAETGETVVEYGKKKP